MSTTGRFHRRRIGELLVSEGLVSPPQLEQALDHQKDSGELLGTILMEMGIITESDITKVLCVQYQLPFLSLQHYEFDPKLVDLFPREFMHQHALLPFDKLGKTLLLLVAEIPLPEILEEVPKQTNLNAALYVGYLTEVLKQLDDLVPLPQSTTPQAIKTKAGTTIEIVPADTADEKAAGGPALIFGDDKSSLLEELDTTWDLIFQDTDAEETDAEGTDAAEEEGD